MDDKKKQQISNQHEKQDKSRSWSGSDQGEKGGSVSKNVEEIDEIEVDYTTDEDYL